MQQTGFETFAAGAWQVKRVRPPGGRWGIYKVRAEAMSDGLYTGPALRIHPREEQGGERVGYVWAIPRADTLTTWTAMKLLERMPEVETQDLARCYYAARLEDNHPRNAIRRVETAIGALAREEIIRQVPPSEEWERILNWFEQRHYPFSLLELREAGRKEALTLPASIKARVERCSHRIEKEIETRESGLRVGALGALRQIRGMNNRWAHAFADVFEKHVTGLGEGALTAFCKTSKNGIRFVLLGRSREQSNMGLLLDARSFSSELKMRTTLRISLLLDISPSQIANIDMPGIWQWDDIGGVVIEDPKGGLLSISDPQFVPVFQTLAEEAQQTEFTYSELNKFGAWKN